MHHPSSSSILSYSDHCWNWVKFVQVQCPRSPPRPIWQYHFKEDLMWGDGETVPLKWNFKDFSFAIINWVVFSVLVSNASDRVSKSVDSNDTSSLHRLLSQSVKKIGDPNDDSICIVSNRKILNFQYINTLSADPVQLFVYLFDFLSLVSNNQDVEGNRKWCYKQKI